MTFICLTVEIALNGAMLPRVYWARLFLLHGGLNHTTNIHLACFFLPGVTRMTRSPVRYIFAFRQMLT